MKIAVAALHNDNPSIVEMAEETIYKNKKAYCEKHGYDLVVNTEDFGSFGSKGIEHFGFAKLPMILNLFERRRHRLMLRARFLFVALLNSIELPNALKDELMPAKAVTDE